MKLIVDSGATKTEWAVLYKNEVVERFITKGFNPYYISREKIEAIIREALPASLESLKIRYIYFFGTGCSSKDNCNLIQSILNGFFPEATISVDHDLVGATVALLKNKKGIACILGTGSNSCLWDGKQITENVPSLGYMIGDEGSAVYLGKLLLKEILGNKVDKELSQLFYEFVNMDFTQVLHRIYKDPDAKHWIGSLSYFITKNIQHPQIVGIARRNFKDFIDNQVSEYTGFRELQISFLGSVAYHLKEILKEVMNEEGLKTGIILQSPMDGLIEYYREN